MSHNFEGVLYGVNDKIGNVLQKVSKAVKKNTSEIRLRAQLPLALTVSGETVFVKKNGQTAFFVCEDLLIPTKEDLTECFKLLCKNSVFAHEEELKKGYIKLKNGCRAGVFGTYNGNIMQDITSINIRIAREIYGVATKISHLFEGEGWLIAGPPGSGKTTVLRDFIREISGKFVSEKIYRVAVIDSRGELSGYGKNNLGLACDVLNIPDKALGIEMAVRTMFPEIIAFDEIGTSKELEQVQESFNAGVTVITTAHIGETEELVKRKVTRELLHSGVIGKVAILPKIHGGEIEVLSVGEILNAMV